MNEEKCRCYKCGKVLDTYDKIGGIKFEKVLGYGTSFDGDRIVFELCLDCSEKQIKEWQRSFIISPIGNTYPF